MDIGIDTLTIFERLKKAEVNEAAAREISEIFKEQADRMVSHQEHVLATKVDLSRETGQVKVEINQGKADIIKWVAGMLVAQAALISTLVKLL